MKEFQVIFPMLKTKKARRNFLIGTVVIILLSIILTTYLAKTHGKEFHLQHFFPAILTLLVFNYIVCFFHVCYFFLFGQFIGFFSRISVYDEGITYKMGFITFKFKFQNINRITVIDEQTASEGFKLEWNLSGLKGICIEADPQVVSRMKIATPQDAKGIEIFIKDFDGFIDELKANMPNEVRKRILIEKPDQQSTEPELDEQGQVKKIYPLHKKMVIGYVIGYLIYSIMKIFFFQTFYVASGSMAPTLLEGDRVLVNKYVYLSSAPQRGDIVVYSPPRNSGKKFIHRIVALPNEKVQFKNGIILVNDAELKGSPYENKGGYVQESQVMQVPAGGYFVLGDNRTSGQDSRYLGVISKDSIIGKAAIIYYPFNRTGPIK